MIQPPNWKKDAIPARNGWKDPKTGEILKNKEVDFTRFFVMYLQHEAHLCAQSNRVIYSANAC